jgi:hypothetical protein
MQETIHRRPMSSSSVWQSTSRIKRTHDHLFTSKLLHHDQRSPHNHHHLATNRAPNHHLAKTYPAPFTANQTDQQVRRRHLQQPALPTKLAAPYHLHKQQACNHHRLKPHHRNCLHDLEHAHDPHIIGSSYLAFTSHRHSRYHPSQGLPAILPRAHPMPHHRLRRHRQSALTIILSPGNIHAPGVTLILPTKPLS